MLNGDEPVSTLTQDFHTRLDNLLRTLVHAKPHFVRCLRPNEVDSPHDFDRNLVTAQIRSLQILETVHLMSEGFPHRMRFKAFNARYRLIAHSARLNRPEEAAANPNKAVEDCEAILDAYSGQLKLLPRKSLPRNTQWAHGRKHVFLSEGARQQLERMRDLKRAQAATKIQAVWRGRRGRRLARQKRLDNPLGLPQISGIKPLNNNNFELNQQFNASTRRGRPQPISGTPPPNLGVGVAFQGGDLMQTDRCNFEVIQKTCALFGLDLVRDELCAIAILFCAHCPVIFRSGRRPFRPAGPTQSRAAQEWLFLRLE